jgi:hypothetical protein
MGFREITYCAEYCSFHRLYCIVYRGKSEVRGSVSKVRYDVGMKKLGLKLSAMRQGTS